MSDGYSPIAVSQYLLAGLQLGHDVDNRSMYLFGEINDANAYRFVSGFKFLDHSPGPIHVVLNSPGGDVDAGFAIYDALRTAENPVIIEGTGIIASAAVPIFLAGTARFINPETHLMIHYMSFEMEGRITTPVFKSLADVQERINTRYTEIIASRTGKSLKQVEKWCEDEQYFNAVECVKEGFADKVIEVREFPKSFKDAEDEVRQAMVAQGVLAPSKSKKVKAAKGKKNAKSK